MKTVSMLHFRQHAEKIIAQVQKGERMILTRRGKPVARLRRSFKSRSMRTKGNEIHVDTSGFYALLIKGDDRHVEVARVLREARRRKRRFVTSDYVLDETATLLKARGHMLLLTAFFGSLRTSNACRIEWTDTDRFHRIQMFFLKHANQAWSFTDCLSFQIMKELRLREALTKDDHFHEAGFAALLK